MPRNCSSASTSTAAAWLSSSTFPGRVGAILVNGVPMDNVLR
jgi:hypothetical protein